MSNYPTKIQEIIQKRGLRKLIHFTRLKNLESIYKYGILSRDQIEKEKIQVEFNDSWRRDAWLKTSSFSVRWHQEIRIAPRILSLSSVMALMT